MPGVRTPTVVELDLADRSSPARLADEWQGPLHLLVDNAGVVRSDLERTAEGWELQFATNHLGHFALTTGLRRALAEGAADRGEARVVALSSGAHMRSPVVFDDIHFEHRPMTHNWPTRSRRPRTCSSLSSSRVAGQPTASSRMPSTPAVYVPGYSGISLPGSAHPSMPQKQRVFSATRPPSRVRPLRLLPRPLRSSRTSAVATSTTGKRHRPCPTSPRWPTTPMRSRRGRSIPLRPSDCGAPPNRCSGSDPVWIPQMRRFSASGQLLKRDPGLRLGRHRAGAGLTGARGVAPSRSRARRVRGRCGG